MFAIGIAVRNNFNVKTSLIETARSFSSSDTSILTEAVVLSFVPRDCLIHAQL